MIASLRGILAERRPEALVIETSGGIGYQVMVPLTVFERLPQISSEVRLFTELVVREDSWSLYGFDTEGERVIFQRLMAASGVGPRIALTILSTLGPDRTVNALRDKSVAVLSSVPGIGRKKAERLILELGDRLDQLPLSSSPPPASSGADAVRALVSLGWTPAQAESTIRTVSTETPDLDTMSMVRRALTELTRK